MDRKETEKEKLIKEIEILEKDVGINQSPGEFVQRSHYGRNQKNKL